MELLKQQTLAQYDAKDVVIFCDDTLVSNFCGAATKHFYTLCEKNAEDVTVYCVSDDEYVSVDNIKDKKLAIFMEVPVDVSVQEHCTSNKIKVIYVANGYPEKFADKHCIMQVTSEESRICETWWNFLFPSATEIKIPTCATYIDDYITGIAKERGTCFYYGMLLMETCPNTSQPFWSALFDCRENLSSDATEEEVMERMRWDTMLQVTNMGSVIKTYTSIITERACANALDYEKHVFVNIRDNVNSTLFEYFPDKDFIITFYTLGLDCDDNVIFEYTVHSNSEDANALGFARKHGGSGSKRRATFITTLKPEEIGM